MDCVFLLSPQVINRLSHVILRTVETNEFDRCNVDNVTVRETNINKIKELSFAELFTQWKDFEQGENNK